MNNATTRLSLGIRRTLQQHLAVEQHLVLYKIEATRTTDAQRLQVNADASRLAAPLLSNAQETRMLTANRLASLRRDNTDDPGSLMRVGVLFIDALLQLQPCGAQTITQQCLAKQTLAI